MSVSGINFFCFGSKVPKCLDVSNGIKQIKVGNTETVAHFLFHSFISLHTSTATMFANTIDLIKVRFYLPRS